MNLAFVQHHLLSIHWELPNILSTQKLTYAIIYQPSLGMMPSIIYTHIYSLNYKGLLVGLTSHKLEVDKK